MTRAQQFLSIATFVLAALCGCEQTQAPNTSVLKPPEPTINLHPHKTTILKITVQPGSGIDNVEVYTDWEVTNLGCAPVRPFSGASVTKQVNTIEKVTKEADQYTATIIKDRFLPDKCRWEGGGYGINLMHGKTLFGVVGVGYNDFRNSKKAQFICMPPPGSIPVCDSINKEAFDRSHFKGTFNVSVEIEE